jgi:hypothetical protein
MHIPNRDFGILVDGKPVFDHRHPKNPCVTVRTKGDKFTIELAMAVSDVIFEKTGRYPHIIINHLRRQKLDCNCDRSEATFEVPEMVDAWEAYHKFIQMAKTAIGSNGLFIDIHGHSHPEGWIELGYTINVQKLDAGLYQATDTSIRGLHERLAATGHPVNIRELVSGNASFGGLLASYPSYSDLVVPSPRHPGPMGSSYYNGGYNVIRHGSKSGGLIDGIQIESPIEYRMPANRLKYAEVIGSTIATFLDLYYA